MSGNPALAFKNVRSVTIVTGNYSYGENIKGKLENYFI